MRKVKTKTENCKIVRSLFLQNYKLRKTMLNLKLVFYIKDYYGKYAYGIILEQNKN